MIAHAGRKTIPARVVVVLLAATLASAQSAKPAPVGSWNRVVSLPPGAEVRVKRTGVKKQASGGVVGADADSIRIRGKSTTESFAKAEVQRVSVARKHKTRNTVIGAAVGGGVGAGLMGGIAALGQREGADDDYTGIFAVLGFVIGAVIGAPLGLVSGSGYQPVYEVGAAPSPATR